MRERKRVSFGESKKFDLISRRDRVGWWGRGCRTRGRVKRKENGLGGRWRERVGAAGVSVCV